MNDIQTVEVLGLQDGVRSIYVYTQRVYKALLRSPEREPSTPCHALQIHQRGAQEAFSLLKSRIQIGEN